MRKLFCLMIFLATASLADESIGELNLDDHLDFFMFSPEGPDPNYSTYVWRFMPSIGGWRKFTQVGAMRKDYYDFWRYRYKYNWSW